MSLLVARRGILAAGSSSASAPSADYATEVAADSPDWWLRLEETSGATVSDEVGSNDGTVTGANLNVSSFADTGSAASFDGTDDKIEVSNDALLNAGDTFSFECLVKLDSPTANALQVIADKTGLSSGNNQWGFWWDNRSSQGSPLRLRFACLGGSSAAHWADWTGTVARDAIAAGVHLVGTFDKAESVSVRLYADGTEVAVSDSGTASSPSANTRPVDIANSGSSFWLDGILDEVAIYSKVLSTSRIAAHASAAGL